MAFEKIIDRENEFEILEKQYLSKRSGLIAIYGRRRIGKSFFLTKFTLKHQGLYFEALEAMNTQEQIAHFLIQLSEQLHDPVFKHIKATSWNVVFDFLTKYLNGLPHKLVIVFDEFQWMAAGQSKLVSLLKFYWDNHWKNKKLQLVLCGSISSYMISKVIRSKALYGRIDIQMRMNPLSPVGISQILKNKISEDEVIKYMFIFGGVPKYFDLVDIKKSFHWNIQQLCFEKDAYFSEEFEKIFYSQFKKHKLHEKIILLLSKKNLTLEEIAKHLNLSSGGGLQRYLKELEEALFIRSHASIETKGKKGKKYKLADEYLIFYFKFIRQNLKLIRAGQGTKIFSEQVYPKWSPWTGIAFENFCYRNLSKIVSFLEIDGKLTDFGPYFSSKVEGVQVDLVLMTNENTTYVCECKYTINKIDASVIKDFEKKLALLKLPRSTSIKKVLISANGVTSELEKSEYFDYIMTAHDFF